MKRKTTVLELFRFLRPKIFKLLKPKFNSADLIDYGPSFLQIFIWKKSQPPHNDLPDDLILFFPAFILFFSCLILLHLPFFWHPKTSTHSNRQLLTTTITNTSITNLRCYVDNQWSLIWKMFLICCAYSPFYYFQFLFCYR